MPQIPTFNATQRLEPGSPVAAVSPEGTAGAKMGEATHAFGTAMLKFGNMLDEAGRKSKDDADNLEATILANNFKISQVQAQSQIQAEAVNLKDDASGYDSVKRYQTALAPVLETLNTQASSDHVRMKFQSLIGDDIAKGSSSILASTIAKREAQLPLMRQENLNGKARLGRSSYQVAQIAASEYEADILGDTSISPADKPAAILNGKKVIGKEAILGIYDNVSSMAGKPGAMAASKKFDEAETRLQTEWSMVFTSEEKDKLSKEIRTAKDEYFTNNWKILTQNETLATKERTDNNQKANLFYSTEMAKAGSDQQKRNVIIAEIAKDPWVAPEAKTSLIKMGPVFAEVSNDNYEAHFLEKLYTGKMNTNKLLSDLDSARSNGTIDDNRKIALMQKVHEMADRTAKNPGLTGLQNAARGEVLAQFGVSNLVVDDMLFKEAKGKQAAAAVFDLHRKFARLYQDGTISPETITEAKNQVFKEQGMVRLDPVRGAALPAYDNANEAIKAREVLFERGRREGKNWTESQYKDQLKALQAINANIKKLQDKEANKINTRPSGGTTVQGD